MFLVVPVTIPVMTERTLTEVGRIVSERREELRLNRTELSAAAGVDFKTLAALEDGQRWPRDKSRARIEQALRWTPGSLRAARLGEEPTIMTATPTVEEEPLIIHASRTMWESIESLAEEVAGIDSPALHAKTRRVVAISGDILTDMLLASDASSQAGPLLKDIFASVAHYLNALENSSVGEPEPRRSLRLRGNNAGVNRGEQRRKRQGF